jgi:hypothetical protein
MRENVKPIFERGASCTGELGRHVKTLLTDLRPLPMIAAYGETPEKQPEPTQQTVEPLEQKLNALENSQEKMFSILKGGFGTLATLALALLAGNIYSSHSNYERDKDSLKQQVEILEKQLTLAQQELTASNEKKLFELKTETESSFLTISNNLQAQLATILKTNDAKWFATATAITNASELIKSNLLTLDAQIYASVNALLSNSTSETKTNVERFTDLSLASALMVQAANTSKKDLRGKQSAFHDYIVSAVLYLRARDEDNGNRAMSNLKFNNVFELYLEQVSKHDFKALQVEHPVDEELTGLINQLKALNDNGRYSDDINLFQFCSGLIKDKLSK